jgi:hypothetical protein
MMKVGRGRAYRAGFLSNNIFMQSKGLHCHASSVTDASPGPRWRSEFVEFELIPWRCVLHD